MTGWRLGWMVLPADLVRPVECLAQNLFISPPTLSQHRGRRGLRLRDRSSTPTCAATPATARLLLESCRRRASADFAPADGAFYLYADVGHLTNDSVEFCRRMLAEDRRRRRRRASISTRQRGNRYVRFSYAGSEADTAEAARR